MTVSRFVDLAIIRGSPFAGSSEPGDATLGTEDGFLSHPYTVEPAEKTA
jgi:hypothetical protein